MKQEERNPDDYDLLVSPAFKLKDKPNRQYQMIDLKRQFGAMPEVIIIEKVRGSNNKLIVKAFVRKDPKNIYPKNAKIPLEKKKTSKNRSKKKKSD